MPHIALHLIAKNEAEKLPRLLASIAGHVDEVVLCDTGSTDETKQIFNNWADTQPDTLCTLVEFDWVDDFAAARNAALAAVSDDADFLIWADCDDVVRGAEKLRPLAEQMPAQIAGLIFPYEYAHDEHRNVICTLERERLVRRSAVSGWQLPIHEVMQVNGQLARSADVVWVHDRDPEKQDPERNFKILKADYERSLEQDEPPNPRTLIYLGTESLALNRPQDALHWLRQYLDIGSWDEEVCQAWHKLSIAYRALHDQGPADALLRDAEDAALHAIAARPDWADGYIDLAELAIRREQPEQALRFIDKARICGQPQTLLIINPADYSYQLDVIESVALAKLGRHTEALDKTAAALNFSPSRQDLHAQAFGLGEQVKSEETVAHVLALYELLVRHDENAKAYELLQSAPYYVFDDPRIAETRRNQRENILHAFEPETYTEFYENNPGEAPFELQQIPIREAHERFMRVGFLRADLEAWQAQRKGPRYLSGLDLGANDGWVAANLSLIGARVDGIEMNPEPVERAQGRKTDYPGMGEIVAGDVFDAPELFEPGSYDFAYCFEVIEHVPDPQLLLDVMERMVRPGGRCYVSTPDGAYERGRVEGWAKVELKGHLRAIRNEELAGWLCERGVIEGFEVLPDRTQVAAWTPKERKGKVVFYAGNLFSEALPEKILTEGMGGSETALCKLAEQFARKGYDVRVYAGAGGGLRGDQVTTAGQEPMAGQVLYSPAAAWDPGEACDLFVASRLPEAFDRRIAAPRRVLWLHDADYADRLTELRAKRCTEIVVLSEFQRDLLADKYPHITDKLYVSRNGIEPLLFRETAPHAQREPLVVYTSSPDRGLDVLLECWPAIRRRVPDAKLIHAYASVYKTMAAANPALGEFHRRLEGLEAKCDGVEARESLNQREVAELYSRAAVWAYPSRHSMGSVWFPEISCISAMEAQAGGAYPVVADFGALQETVRVGERVPVTPDLDDFKQRFVAAVVSALKSPAKREKAAVKGRTWALEQGWEGVADDWEARLLVRELEPLAA